MQKILLGTTNKGKMAEIRSLLPMSEHSKWTSLDAFDTSIKVIENGMSFKENALIKAKAYSQYFGLPCLAEDSGLCIEALGTKPGIFSARYASKEATSKENMIKVLKELAHASNREAYYSCVMCFYTPSAVFYTHGKCEGYIAKSIQGDNGFGYDPIFIPKGHTKTFGELSKDVKKSLSHRKQAFEKMIETTSHFTDKNQQHT